MSLFAPRDYADRLSDARSEGCDVDTAHAYAGSAVPLRRFMNDEPEKPETNMTDEELNEEIAKWLGWKRIEISNWLGTFWVWLKPGMQPSGPDGNENTVKDLPSCITGLEALGNMHAAEKELTSAEHFTFRQELWALSMPFITNPDEQGRGPERHYASSTARHRGIALLRAVKPEMFE